MRAATTKAKTVQKKRAVKTARKSVRQAKRVKSWRDAIDWAAAGRKAFETRMRNLGVKATAAPKGAPVAPAARVVRARLDKDAAAYEARLLASMARSTPAHDRDRIAAQLGRDFGGGWVCLGTDGVRALLRHGGTALPDSKPLQLTTEAAPVNGINLTGEFCDALRSLQLATRGTHGKTGKSFVEIAIDGRAKKATLRMGPLPPAKPETREVKAEGGKLKSLTLRVNLALLLDGCGRGGRLGYIDGPEKPLCLDTPDGLRYLVMGVRS